MNIPAHNLATAPAPTALDLAAQAFREAKIEEDRAKEKRVHAQAALLEAHAAEAGAVTEGAVPVKTEFFKITATYKLTRSLDRHGVDALADRLPAAIFDEVIETKPSLRLKGYRDFVANHPDDEYLKLVNDAVTTKPASPAVKVEVI